jgi:hypothetical protein
MTTDLGSGLVSTGYPRSRRRRVGHGELFSTLVVVAPSPSLKTGDPFSSTPLQSQIVDISNQQPVCLQKHHYEQELREHAQV